MQCKPARSRFFMKKSPYYFKNELWITRYRISILINKALKNTSAPILAPSTPCALGWFRFPGNNLCYKSFKDARSQVGARTRCGELNARLTNPRDEAELAFIRGLVAPKGRAWVDLTLLDGTYAFKMSYRVWFNLVHSHYSDF